MDFSQKMDEIVKIRDIEKEIAQTLIKARDEAEMKLEKAKASRQKTINQELDIVRKNAYELAEKLDLQTHTAVDELSKSHDMAIKQLKKSYEKNCKKALELTLSEFGV